MLVNSICYCYILFGFLLKTVIVMSCSSPSSCGDGSLRIAFNVERLPPRSWCRTVLSPTGVQECSERSGLATGWLEGEALLAQSTGARRKVLRIVQCRVVKISMKYSLSAL